MTKKETENGNMNERIIPRPSAEEVEKYLERWEKLEKYPEQEKGLDMLFGEYPRNNDLSEVLLKVATLNTFYSTNILDVYSVARHILEIDDFDERLANGEPKLVDDLKEVEINGRTKKFYSFASKYCSHHNPDNFPIYDYHVERMLMYFKNNETVDGNRFATFTYENLKTYSTFKKVVEDFRKAYGLEKYTFKQIDRYLWLSGKDHFPRNKKTSN